jgi:hypothetical protein
MIKEGYTQCMAPCQCYGDDVWLILTRKENVARIAFQGTATVRGVFIDANFPTMIYKEEKTKWYVHNGFGKSFKTAIDSIAAQLEGVSQLYIYGFSKGGAYAQLLHEWSIFRGIDVTTIIYGAPAIFWFPKKEIKDRFKKLYRVAIRGDWCPPLSQLAGYSHVGNPVKLGPVRFDYWLNHHAKYKEWLADF